PRGGSGARFGPHHQSPRQHRWQKLIKDARALSLVRPTARELQKVGDVPDQLLDDCDFVGRLTNAALQLAEPLLARHQIRSAGLEYGPALLGESLREQPKHGGFPDELFAAD